MRTLLTLTKSVALGAILFTAFGCASIMNSRTVYIPVQTEPTQATLTVDGKTYQSPAIIELPRGHDTFVMRVEKEGFRSADVTFKKSLSDWSMGNFAFLYGAPVGFIVDFSTGMGYDISPKEVYVSMNPTDGVVTSQGMPQFGAGRTLSTKPLIIAAANGNTDKIKELLKSNMQDINQIDELNGKNALFVAIENGYRNIAFMLVDAGVSLNHRDFMGQTALMKAAAVADFDMARYLVQKGADVNAVDEAGNSVLMVTASGQNPNIATLLIKNKADVNRQSLAGDTALMVAARNGSTSIVDVLVQNGADVNVLNLEGATPLMGAVSRGHYYTALKLVESGADTSLRTTDGSTALMMATKRGYTAIAYFLALSGASVNDSDNAGNTPLMHAVLSGNAELVKTLLRLGADPALKNNKGVSAFDLAEENRMSAIMDILGSAAPAVQ